MPINNQSLNKELYKLLKVRGFDPIPKDSTGETSPVPDEADVFKFTFKQDGKAMGTAWATVDGDNNLTVYYGDDVTQNVSEDERMNDSFDLSWTGFLKHLKMWAQRKQMGFDLENKDHLHSDMAQREYTKKQESMRESRKINKKLIQGNDMNKVNEGYYPMGKAASYNDAIPTVKIILQHTRQIQEGEQRYRNIARIFLENTQGERFLAPTNKPGIAQIYARHLAEGGVPNDERWNHIKSLCEEYMKMSGFVRAVRNNQFNESAQKLINEGINHYQNLRESLSKMRGHRGYNAYFESWTPTLMENEGEENTLNELFVQETLDPRIESVMPILNKLSKNISEVKEVKELEEWADKLTEAPGAETLAHNQSTASSNLKAFDLEEQEVEESGLQAYLGNKKYGKNGMDALRKAGREDASKEKMAKIRAKYDKLDEEGVAEADDPTSGTTKKYPNTKEGVLQYMQSPHGYNKSFLKQLDLPTCKIRPDPSIEGVWTVDSMASGYRCIIYLAGYRDQWGEIRRENDNEEGSLPEKMMKSMIENKTLTPKMIKTWTKLGSVEPEVAEKLISYHRQIFGKQGVAEGSNSSPFDQIANLKSKSNKELDELVRFWQRALEKNPNHKVANDQLHIIKMLRAERIGKKGVAEGTLNELSSALLKRAADQASDRGQKAYTDIYNIAKAGFPEYDDPIGNTSAFGASRFAHNYWSNRAQKFRKRHEDARYREVEKAALNATGLSPAARRVAYNHWVDNEIRSFENEVNDYFNFGHAESLPKLIKSMRYPETRKYFLDLMQKHLELKKSKQGVAEETELDEVSQDALRNYFKKSVADLSKRQIKMNTGSADSNDAKKMQDRKKGLSRASAKIAAKMGEVDPVKQGVAEGYILKKTKVEKTFTPGDPDEYYTSGGADVTRKDTDYEIINNKTGQVVGTASWTTNDYFGPGALKITMKNGATRYLDIWASEKGNPQTAFNRFVKDPNTAKKYKEQGVAEGSAKTDLHKELLDINQLLKYYKTHPLESETHRISLETRKKEILSLLKQQGVAEGQAPTYNVVNVQTGKSVGTFRDGAGFMPGSNAKAMGLKPGPTVPNGHKVDYKSIVSEQGVAEDIDANQKRVGQLGPTGGPAKVGDLVGANESIDPLKDMLRLLGK